MGLAVITRVLTKKRQECKGQKRCDDMVIDVEGREKMAQDTIQGMCLKAEKDKGMNPALEPLGGNTTCQHLDFSPVIPILNF